MIVRERFIALSSESAFNEIKKLLFREKFKTINEETSEIIVAEKETEKIGFNSFGPICFFLHVGYERRLWREF